MIVSLFIFNFNVLKFILKLTIFIFPLFVLLFVIEYRARSVPNNFAVKRAVLEQNINRAQVIITGASHAYYGIKPGLLGVPAVSIAYTSQDIYYDTRILLKYLPEAANARLVIINLNYASFEGTMGDAYWRDQRDFYYRFWKIPREEPTFRLADYSFIILFGAQRTRDFLLTGKVVEKDEVDENGGTSTLRETNPDVVKDGETPLKRHSSAMHTKNIVRNVGYLDELLGALEAKGIRAVFVTTPCFNTYYSGFDAGRYERMQTEIKKLGQRHKVEYINYLKDSRFELNDFQDSDHLNSSGAEKFSLILKDEVVKKYLD